MSHASQGSVAVAALLGAALVAIPLGARAATNDSISYDAVGFDRVSVDREASNYCALHGKSAVFTGLNGSRYTYDCVPATTVVYTPPPPAVTYAPAVTYVTTPAYVATPAPAYVAPAAPAYVAAPVVPPPTYLPTQAALPAPAPAYVAPARYTPVPSYSTFGNGSDNPSVTYDADKYDRLAIMTAATNFCAAQGKSSAFSGRNGSLVHYDCVPYSDANHAPPTPIYPAGAPYVVYEFTTGTQTTFDTQAAAYCTAQGRAAVFRSQDGTRITYDCVLAGQPYTAPVYRTYAENVPVAVPTISYSTAGNNQANVDQQAIRYCGMLGKSPVLRDQYYSNRTYTCQ
jgi:hypothetical protein